MRVRIALKMAGAKRPNPSLGFLCYDYPDLISQKGLTP